MGNCYTNNLTQLVIMSLTVFACPGMFNALNSIGLGGDPSIGNLVNCCLYGTWMLTSIFAPTVVNIFGAKWVLLLGTWGYPLYSLAMFFHVRAWAVAAGVLLGFGAGLLWTAQGQLMMSYPRRSQTGRFVATFWGIFNSGGVLGCLMSFFLNLPNNSEGADATAGASLSAGTYWTFFSIMCCGIVMSTALLPLRNVTRVAADGCMEYVINEHGQEDSSAPSNIQLILQELRRTVKSFSNPTMLLLVPLFFYSNFFYEYHFGIIGVVFNGRTGSLTATSYWVAQILGSFILQGFLDWGAMSRQRRMYMSLTGILAYVAFTWAFGGYVQYSFRVSSDKQALDFAGELRSPISAMIGLFAWGFVDSFVQVWSYWVMGQLSDQPEELACFTAFYKLWQNAGAFASFLLGVFAKSYVLDYWVNIALIVLLIAPTFLAVRSIFSGDDKVSCQKQAATGDMDDSATSISDSSDVSKVSDSADASKV